MEDKTEQIEQLLTIAKAEGGYQNIEYGDKIILKGWRQCEERWDKIKKHIRPGWLVADVGSHYGYFGKKANDMDCIVWSIEDGELRSDIQKRILELNKPNGLYLTKTHFTVNHFLDLYRTTEFIDAIFVLSFLHYFEPQDYRNIIYLLSLTVPNVFIEMPDPCEDNVAGFRDTIEINHLALWENFFTNIQELGQYNSPDGKGQRKLYLLQNFKLYRTKLIGYAEGEPGRLHSVKYTRASNKNWSLDHVPIEPLGFNLHNLLKCKMIYPDPERIVDTCTNKYLDLIKSEKGHVTDIALRNCIAGKKEPIIIDYKEKVGERIYGAKWKDYVNKIKTFDFDKLKDDILTKF